MSGHATTAALTLRERVLRAGGWSLAGFGAGQGIRLASNLIMTRLLAPEMWGVMAISFTVIMVVSLFSDIGLRQSVVRSARGSEPAFLNTVWVTKIGISAVITLAVSLLALALAVASRYGLFPEGSTYASPDLPGVLAVVGCSALISGFESTKTLEASRRLVIGRLTQMSLVAQVASLVSMLLLALVARSIWVLVAGWLVSAATTTLLSHLWLPGTRNRLAWDRECFHEIMEFGKWILGSSSIGVVAGSMDTIILGALASPTTLGVYAIASLLFFAGIQLFTKFVGDVIFPGLSEVARERRHDLGRTVYKFHTPVALVAYCVAGCLLVAAPTVVELLYDSRYQDAGWMLQILSVAFLAVPGRVHAMALLAFGNSRVFFVQSLVGLATIVIALPLGYYYFGLQGAMWGIAAYHLSALPLALGFAARYGTLTVAKEIGPLAGLLPGLLIGLLVTHLLGR